MIRSGSAPSRGTTTIPNSPTITSIWKQHKVWRALQPPHTEPATVCQPHQVKAGLSLEGDGE